jgi:hypothetical protein
VTRTGAVSAPHRYCDQSRCGARPAPPSGLEEWIRVARAASALGSCLLPTGVASWALLRQ